MTPARFNPARRRAATLAARGVPLRARTIVLAAAGLALATGCTRQEEPLAASAGALALDRQIDWSRARLIAVQDGNRYKTLDSFAREALHAMTGREHLPGLSPMASLMEWLFNRGAYADAPLVRIKEKGLRLDLSVHMNEAARQRVRRDGRMTPRELEDPAVARRLDELEPQATMRTAMNRLRSAEMIARFAERLVRIVPQHSDDPDAPWFLPVDLAQNVAPDFFQRVGQDASAMRRVERGPVPGVAPEQAEPILVCWLAMERAWSAGNAAIFQKSIDTLAGALPRLAHPGVYPTESQRRAETRYYAMRKFTWGYWLYMLGALVSIAALVTRWRAFWIIALALLTIAMMIHAYGIGLRWYILGRIPVANMFEAVVASAWVGIAVAFVVELIFRPRVFLLAAHATGFLALVLAGHVIPGGGTLTSIMGILDDVMLRIHTVLIISSYSMIFLAAVIAAVYLFGYYFHSRAAQSAEVGLLLGLGGLLLFALSRSPWVYESAIGDPTGITARAAAGPVASGVGAAGLLALMLVRFFPLGVRVSVGAAALAVALGGASIALTPHGFVRGLGLTLLAGGFAWAALNAAGLYRRALMARLGGRAPALALAGGGLVPAGASLRSARPILAGAMPGDESLGRALPDWLHQLDWCHLIILNMVFVLLFVGTILGAVWADYSWGRPWGWDPKEVFALNTWLIYAILIHTRFIVKKKGLWTAWLSVAGCAMMAFNWCFVNFFIVGLHSYA